MLYREIRARVGGRFFYYGAEPQQPGSDISHTLRSKVEESTVVLVLVGEHFLNGFDHPLDWVRGEVETALAVDGRTAVVSVDGARIEATAIDQLTDPIARNLAKQLRNQLALNLRLDNEHFETDCTAIVEHLYQLGFPRPSKSRTWKLATIVAAALLLTVAGLGALQHFRLDRIANQTPWIARSAAAAYRKPPQASDVDRARTALAALESGTRWLWFLETRRREYAATVDAASSILRALAAGPIDPTSLPGDAGDSWRVAFSASALLGQVAEGPPDKSLAALEGLAKLREHQPLDAEARHHWQALTVCSGVPISQADVQVRMAWVAVFAGIGLANAPDELCQSTFRDAMAAPTWARLRGSWWRGDANRFEDAVARSMAPGMTAEQLAAKLHEIRELRTNQVAGRDNQTGGEARLCALTTALCLLDHAVRRPGLTLDVPAIEPIPTEVLQLTTSDFRAALATRFEQWRNTDTDAARSLVAWVRTRAWNVTTLGSVLSGGN